MKNIFKTWTATWTILLLVLSLSGTSAYADRIKDLTTVAAMRSNQLIGYGLVVGLQGTGDGSDVSFTAQSMKTLLNRLGVSMEGPLSDFETATSSGKLDIKNVAAVMVTAELPGFAKPGQKIDITVSAIGKASNLRGGTLLLSSLRGVNFEIYSLAPVALTCSGFAAGAGGATVVVGVPTGCIF
jgi:flagellar P-ring protein precursor FlgI